MLHTLNDLNDFAIHASNGTLGLVKDFYFDDRKWVVRYFVVETGSWLLSRKVLLSPIAVKHLNREDKTLTVAISMEQVESSPHIDTQKPVSRQYEIDYLGYYGYPYYWGNADLWGSYPNPCVVASSYVEGKTSEVKVADKDAVGHHKDDHHLQSCKAVIDYHIHAADGDIGHLEGMLIDEETWAIRYLIINTSNWWLGHQVLVAPQWIKDVSWIESKIHVNLTRQEVQDAPLFDSSVPFNRELEKGIHLHYGRKGYWES